jgi:putative oxidoreductase
VKASDWDATVALFQYEYSVPLLPPVLAAVMGMTGELVFPMLLAAGVVTRLAALGLFFVNAMAVISYPQLWEFDCPAAINDHLYWGALLLVLAAFGPGKFSLDAWLTRKRSHA